MTGMIEENTGLINQDTGLISDSTGLMENSSGMIEENTGLITENDTEYTESGRLKRSRERGKDSKPRNFPLQTLKNLPQFRDKSHEEVRQYILAKKGVDIGCNFNLGSIMIPILIVSAIVAGGYGLYWLIKQFQKQREMQSENVADTYRVTHE
jgi:hypothetical protein